MISQQHSGKVLVPWYNTSEWKNVYNILCSETEQNYDQVLKILKIWKSRTPLLSAGVEGTLTVLEALLVETSSLSDVQLTQIYAISLLRFLNICATNNERQGTFYKTAVKNDLPKWLIGLRHDIAHDHKLPSNSMLKLGLNQCLEWIKVKYWNVQNEIISDYVVTEESTNAKTVEILNSYVRLNLNQFSNVDITEYDEGLMGKINYMISKKYNKSKTDVKGMIPILEEMLRQSLTGPKTKDVGEGLAKILVSNNGLLSSAVEVTSEGTEIIPRDFKKIWSNLLNILYEKGLLYALLNQLLDVSNNVVQNSHARKVASFWINEIFQGLQKIKHIKEELDSISVDSSDNLDSRTSTIVLKSILDKKHPEYKNCLEFNSPNFLSLAEAQVFQEKVLNFPNAYTLNFLERVLKFNDNSEDYINETSDLVKKLVWPGLNGKDDQMFTTDHLKEMFNSDLNVIGRSNSDETVIIDANTIPNNLDSLNRWSPVKDSSLFQGCPLGILPHQNRNTNPLIVN